MRWLAIGAVAALVAALTGAHREERPRDLGVFVVDAASGAKTRVSAGGGDAEWSRDGRVIYISGQVTFDERHQTFQRLDRRGRRVARERLRVGGIAEEDVAVSPDGRRIAYIGPSRDRSFLNAGELVVRPLAGGRTVRLLARAVGTPVWSPDGRHLAVEQRDVREARGDAGARDRTRVVVVDVARRRTRVAGAGTSPQWLPDGRLLRRTPGDRLLLGARTVVDDISAANGWDVSPDGRALAIAAGQGTTVVDVTTRAEEQLPGGGTNEVRWSPRGGRIAALAGGTLLLLDTSGLGSARILARFPGRQLTGLAWAPSGRRLAVTSTVAERGD